MSVQVATEIACPVCKGSHVSIGTFSGLRMIACPDKKPTGDVAFFPMVKQPVIVIGAGVGVDVKPEEPLTDEQLQEQINRLKTVAANPAVKPKTREELEAELAKLQKA